MALTNKWTNPLRRSFQDIKNDLINAMNNIVGTNNQPLITDRSEGNIFVIIISLFAAIAESLHYYIDNMSREFFISTARRYSSVSKLGLLVDYHAHGANAATVDVVLMKELTGLNSGTDLRISAQDPDFYFVDSNGNHWEPAWDTVWSGITSSCIVPLIQHELYTNSTLNGSTISSEYQTLTLDSASLGGKLIEHNSINLTLGTDKWVQVNTFAYSKPTDKHFMLVVDETDTPIIIFGDGKFGAKPTVGSKISISYYITAGASGNVYANSITKVPSEISSKIQGVTCNNPYASGNGMNYEDMEILRRHIPLHARTMGVAITKQDFIDCAKLVPGVKEAALEYICGRKLNLYISQIRGGTDNTALIKQVEDYLISHAPMTTWLNVLSAGISRINLGIEVTGKPSFHSEDIQSSILQALYDAYSWDKAQIGGKVRISDIYALIDNLPEVDYLYIKKFYVSPWPKIIYGDKQLDLSIDSIDKATGSMKYIISFENDKTFSVYSVDNRFELLHTSVGNVAIEDTVNGFSFKLSIQGSYGQGYKYEITISEPNHDYEEPGFNQVVFDDAKLLTLNVHETV